MHMGEGGERSRQFLRVFVQARRRKRARLDQIRESDGSASDGKKHELTKQYFRDQEKKKIIIFPSGYFQQNSQNAEIVSPTTHFAKIVVKL